MKCKDRREGGGVVAYPTSVIYEVIPNNNKPLYNNVLATLQQPCKVDQYYYIAWDPFPWTAKRTAYLRPASKFTQELRFEPVTS